jgi:hypothetical protein
MRVDTEHYAIERCRRLLRQGSSAVEQGTHKPLVGSSILPPGRFWFCFDVGRWTFGVLVEYRNSACYLNNFVKTHAMPNRYWSSIDSLVPTREPFGLRLCRSAPAGSSLPPGSLFFVIGRDE